MFLLCFVRWRVDFKDYFSPKFLRTSFEVREINTVIIIFRNKFLYTSFGNILSYYSFYAWIKYVLHEKYVRTLYFIYNIEMWRYYVLQIWIIKISVWLWFVWPLSTGYNSWPLHFLVGNVLIWTQQPLGVWLEVTSTSSVWFRLPKRNNLRLATYLKSPT